MIQLPSVRFIYRSRWSEKVITGLSLTCLEALEDFFAGSFPPFVWLFINVYGFERALKCREPLGNHNKKTIMEPSSLLPKQQTAYKQENKMQEEDFQSYPFDSDILLSKIEYDQLVPESPQINYNTAEAKIKELTATADKPPVKKNKPFCGCGSYYSCTSSLYLHIRSKHQGKPPAGTIGGPKGIVKKPPQEPVVKVEEEVAPANYTKFPQNNQDAKVPAKPSNEVQQQKVIPPVTPNAVEPAKKTSEAKKRCKFCNKEYSCNSSLNLHLKRKHQNKKIGTDGRIQIEYVPQEKPSGGYQCSICSLSYGSKSALGLHFNNKHSNKNQDDQTLQYDKQIQKCGCNLIYQSRSALNMHVKKKHGGIYPPGTSEKPNARGQSDRDDVNGAIRGGNERSYSKEQSIYDSDSEERRPTTNKVVQERQEGTEKPNIRCGCGKPYSCSSALNLHIKKNHGKIPPAGTIGGPRGLRITQENKPISHVEESSQKSLTCSECRRCIQKSFFQCKSCDKHQKCSKCFWAGVDSSSTQHTWDIRNLS